MVSELQEQLDQTRAHKDKLSSHIKVAEDWVLEKYSSANEFGKVTDFMLEAGRMFDELGLNQNQTMNINDMIDALSFVHSARGEYF